jgi:hypothetical protein
MQHPKVKSLFWPIKVIVSPPSDGRCVGLSLATCTSQCRPMCWAIPCYLHLPMPADVLGYPLLPAHAFAFGLSRSSYHLPVTADVLGYPLPPARASSVSIFVAIKRRGSDDLDPPKEMTPTVKTLNCYKSAGISFMCGSLPSLLVVYSVSTGLGWLLKNFKMR